MTEQEIRQLVQPEVLVFVEREIRAANNDRYIPARTVVGLRLGHVDYWGMEIGVWIDPLPVDTAPYMSVTPHDLANAGTRPVTADEERAWISRVSVWT